MVSKGIDSEAGPTWLPLLAPSLTAVSPQPQPLRASSFSSVNGGDKSSSTYSKGLLAGLHNLLGVKLPDQCWAYCKHCVSVAVILTITDSYHNQKMSQRMGIFFVGEREDQACESIKWRYLGTEGQHGDSQ